MKGTIKLHSNAILLYLQLLHCLDIVAEALHLVLARFYVVDNNLCQFCLQPAGLGSFLRTLGLDPELFFARSLCKNLGVIEIKVLGGERLLLLVLGSLGEIFSNHY